MIWEESQQIKVEKIMHATICLIYILVKINISVCNQDECSFITNMSPAANVLTTKPPLWACLQQCSIITELKNLHSCEGITNFRLLLRKMKHQAYFNSMFPFWLPVLSKQRACLLHRWARVV